MPSSSKEKQRTYSRVHYLRHKAERMADSKRQKKTLKDVISAYKESKPCKDCADFFPACAMDFDHITSDKVDNIATLVSRYAKKALWKEIVKCELVCANCHRIRTQKRLPSTGIEPVLQD
jgi:L-lysine 2,3-aminomutase